MLRDYHGWDEKLFFMQFQAKNIDQGRKGSDWGPARISSRGFPENESLVATKAKAFSTAVASFRLACYLPRSQSEKRDVGDESKEASEGEVFPSPPSVPNRHPSIHPSLPHSPFPALSFLLMLPFHLTSVAKRVRREKSAPRQREPGVARN